MRCLKWLCAMLMICLLCSTVASSFAEDEVASFPVEEAVGEMGIIDVEASIEGEGSAPVELRGDGKANIAENADGDFVIEDGELIRYAGIDSHVVIPYGVTRIGYDAFYGDENLERATLPDSVTEIGEGAFSWCVRLTQIDIPASVISIDRTAFDGCPGFVIRGTAGTFAEQYAQAIGVPFNAPILYFDEEEAIEAERRGERGEIILHISRERTLKVGQKPADLATTVTWASSNEQIATVDGSGKVKAIATGTATITASTANGRGRTAQIDVNVPEASMIRLNCGSELKLPLGQAMTIEAWEHTPYTDGGIFPMTWTTSDKSVVAIKSTHQTEEGKSEAQIEGVGVGKATVAVSTTDGGRASVEIEVLRPEPTGVKIDRAGPILLNPGNKFALSATVTPEGAVASLEWLVQNGDVATINQNGVVTAVKVGRTQAAVRTTDGRFADIIEVIVTDRAPSSVKLNKTGTVSLMLGKALQLKATVLPSDAQTTLTWQTSNPKVAAVSDAGKVTPVKAGTATITVRTANGKKASVKVKVVAPAPKSVRITNGKSAKLEEGQKLALKAELSPAYAETKLTWSSSDSKVAAVSAKGVVTAKKAGTATITVKTANGKKASIKIKVE